METNFNFKSSVCTSREQSERLLALGLKKDTADMCWIPLNDGRCVIGISAEIKLDIIPAWSLHRLAFLLDASPYPIYLDSNAYNDIIDDIEELIKHNEFNKEYLV